MNFLSFFVRLLVLGNISAVGESLDERDERLDGGSLVRQQLNRLSEISLASEAIACIVTLNLFLLFSCIVLFEYEAGEKLFRFHIISNVV